MVYVNVLYNIFLREAEAEGVKKSRILILIKWGIILIYCFRYINLTIAFSYMVFRDSRDDVIHLEMSSFQAKTWRSLSRDGSLTCHTFSDPNQ